MRLVAAWLSVSLPIRGSYWARVTAIYLFLGLLNIAAWSWAAVAFHGYASLWGIAVVVYGMGLRHAIDADHIAAIDNVTRRLMYAGQRPAAVGCAFALGHSFVVFVIVLVVARLSSGLSKVQGLREMGGAVATACSAFFLIIIGLVNVVIFFRTYRDYRRARDAEDSRSRHVPPSDDGLHGFLCVIFSGMLRMITKSWHMFVVGVIFGLGFDSATEISLLTLAGSQGSNGTELTKILVFPTLFAAAMSLVDMTDGVLMVRAYNWAAIAPTRKLRYNMVVTLISALAAIGVAGIELTGQASQALGIPELISRSLDRIDEHFDLLGLGIVLALLVVWAVAFLIYRRSEGRTRARLALSIPHDLL